MVWFFIHLFLVFMLGDVFRAAPRRIQRFRRTGILDVDFVFNRFTQRRNIGQRNTPHPLGQFFGSEIANDEISLFAKLRKQIFARE